MTVTQTPGWAVTFFDCEQVELHRVQLKDVMADGINPVCSRHVLYDSVNIDGTGDDPITIKNEGPMTGPMLTSDILITNCSVRNTKHPGIKIGTGTSECVPEHHGETLHLRHSGKFFCDSTDAVDQGASSSD